MGEKANLIRQFTRNAELYDDVPHLAAFYLSAVEFIKEST